MANQETIKSGSRARVVVWDSPQHVPSSEPMKKLTVAHLWIYLYIYIYLSIMEKKMEYTILKYGMYRGVTPIMGSQMKKKVENEMETPSYGELEDQDPKS